MNSILRFLLAIWTIAFLVASCVPLVTGNAIAGGIGAVVGAILFVPWLAGAFVLLVLVWLTNPRR